MEHIFIDALVDHRNEKLWKELNANYNIRFENSVSNEYACFAQNEDVIFQIVPNNLCMDSFTHEMLHIFLRMKGCYIGAGLKNTIAQSRLLNSIYSFKLLEHIGNCLDHIKMLPLYLELGFERSKFILDYNVYKCTPAELDSIKRNYKVGEKINSLAVDLLIGKYFAMAADPNPTFDYSEQIRVLRKIDPQMLQISKNMIEQWSKIDLTLEQNNDIDYHSILFAYYEDLKKWLARNKLS